MKLKIGRKEIGMRHGERRKDGGRREKRETGRRQEEERKEGGR